MKEIIRSTRRTADVILPDVPINKMLLFMKIDVGQNILINFCNILYLVFLCNFRYFGFRAFISLFFGAFNAF